MFSRRAALVESVEGLSVAVRLTPGASRDALKGVVTRDDGVEALQASVRAPAVEGKANEALIKMLARALSIARSRIRITAGETSRAKIVFIADGARAMAQRLGVKG